MRKLRRLYRRRLAVLGAAIAALAAVTPIVTLLADAAATAAPVNTADRRGERHAAGGTGAAGRREIAGATDTDYEVKSADLNRTIRVHVAARNDEGTRSAISNPTGVVGQNSPPPPSTGSIAVSGLQAAGDRLVVSEIRSSPNPVTSRSRPITARVRVTARGGRPISGALVFMRATPRVVQGETQATQQDGWVTLNLVPNRFFPQPRNGHNVQFFVKAYRPNDPALGGVAGYRLVQVRLAS